MERSAIENRLAELRGELDHVEGGPTEVYSRIVGYYRSVRNWNAGKREEYAARRTFAMTRPAASQAAGAAPEPRRKAASAAPRKANSRAGHPASPHATGGEVFVFTRETCPNCPPVADYVATSGIEAVFVDVDVDEGLALARAYDVLATPTVLALDDNGAELFRACDLGSVKAAVSARLV